MTLTTADYTDFVEVPNFGPGGPTFVVNTKKQGLKVLCFRGSKKGDGGRCSQVAGAGSDHLGVGACKKHSPATSIKSRLGGRRTGRYADVFRGDLKRRYEAYLNDHNIFDLTDELAVQRTVLSQAIDKAIEEDGEGQAYWLKQMSEVAEKISATVERVLRIQAIQLVTYPLMQYVVARIMDVLVTSMQEFLMISGYAGPADVAEEIAKQYGAHYFVPAWRRAVVGIENGNAATKDIPQFKDVRRAERIWRENQNVEDDD